MCAGIKVVIADNIERIYKQNCQNLGVLTSTNFSLIDKIRGGEEIPLSEFTAGEDEITRQVIEYGGLFPFNVARLQGKVFLPPIENAGKGASSQSPHPDVAKSATLGWGTRPMTLAEKIFARHMINGQGGVGVLAVKPGDTGVARPDLRLSHAHDTPMAALFFVPSLGKGRKGNDASALLRFCDP